MTLPEINDLSTSSSATITSDRVYDVTIEVPRWGFVKRGSSKNIDFISPIPCPYNYGAIQSYIGLDDDFLDAVVVGPRLARGVKISCRAYGAVGLSDRGRYDDKVICASRNLSFIDKWTVIGFFHCYAVFKRILNLLRRQPGKTKCEGWQDLDSVLLRARKSSVGTPKPNIDF